MFVAIDIGTNLGMCVYYPELQKITLSEHCFKNNRFEGGGMRFVRYERFLTELLSVGVKQVFFEEVRRHKGTDAAHIYGAFCGILEKMCEAHKVPYTGIPVGTIKRFITGKGNANKEAMVQNCNATYKIEPALKNSEDNKADALGVMCCGLHDIYNIEINDTVQIINILQK